MEKEIIYIFFKKNPNGVFSFEILPLKPYYEKNMQMLQLVEGGESPGLIA